MSEAGMPEVGQRVNITKYYTSDRVRDSDFEGPATVQEVHAGWFNFDTDSGRHGVIDPIAGDEWEPLHEAAVPADSGRKDDTGKDPWDLAPWQSFGAIVGVMAFGARKYGARNWERGMAWGRLYAACIRHLTAWWGGEDKDPETGKSHLAHAGCCVCFLIAYQLRGWGSDDRPKVQL